MNLDTIATYARRVHGDKFDGSDLAPQFARYYAEDVRIRVETTYPSGNKYIRTGTVGKTTGWKPAFLLMHRSSDVGSSDVLRHDDVITHVQHGRRYVPVNA